MSIFQLPLDEPGSFSQRVTLPGLSLPASGDGDMIAQGFAMVGMEEEKIENAQQVSFK